MFLGILRDDVQKWSSTVNNSHSSSSAKSYIIQNNRITNVTMDSWLSKLGNSYPRKEIELNEKASKAFLDKLRHLPHNKKCADCGMEPTVWASVNLGVFLCLRCGSIHRGIGTHISIPKGCTGNLTYNYILKYRFLLTFMMNKYFPHLTVFDNVGTYLWGPDELQNMESMGNDKAEVMYGGRENRPSDNASDETWKQFIIDKYEKRKFSKVPEVQVADLLNLDDKNFRSDKTQNNEAYDHLQFSSTHESKKMHKTDGGDDFFSQYGV
jgi:GTPase-activating protein that regulates ARFs (ADP-ribosylation factors), involved in ARF-mediated vesicular transport